MKEFDESNITAADRWRNGGRALLSLFLFLLALVPLLVKRKLEHDKKAQAADTGNKEE